MVRSFEKPAVISEKEMDGIEEDWNSDTYNKHGDPLLRIYMRNVAKYPLLSAEDEKRLFAKLDKAREIGDWKKVKQIRGKIILANLRLVLSVAKKFRDNNALHFSDLIQEGNTGLMKAVDRFDYRKGYKFSTYAVWWIRQSVQRAIANSADTIRLPVHIQNGARALKQARAEIREEGKKASKRELSEKTGIPPERVESIIRAQRLKRTVSLDYTLPIDEDGISEIIDFIPSKGTLSPESEVIQSDLKDQIEEVLSDFTERDAEILRLRYGLKNGTEYTLQQIANIFHISRERVRQIQNKILAKLRNPRKKRQLAGFLD